MTETGLQGRVALVTGGSSGIGRATALALGRAGAKVVIAARGAERGRKVLGELADDGVEAAFVQADVSRSDQVEAMVGETVGRFGRLDVAVNNAAAIADGVFTPTADISEEAYDRHLEVNLKSVWLCLRAEIRQMLAQGGGGSIVNVSSINGLGGVAMNGLYAAAKAGLVALTKSAAQEYAKQGVRLNAMVAGGFRTPMLETVAETVAPGNEEAMLQGFAQQVPLGRIGRPEEAAAAILWLASDASSYVTGSSLIVDGGLTSPFR
ncbi:MAG: glucose 1-dehydrogenase [Gemmatimonadales bacterium]